MFLSYMVYLYRLLNIPAHRNYSETVNLTIYLVIFLDILFNLKIKQKWWPISATNCRGDFSFPQCVTVCTDDFKNILKLNMQPDAKRLNIRFGRSVIYLNSPANYKYASTAVTVDTRYNKNIGNTYVCQIIWTFGCSAKKIWRYLQD